jgi:hypothetical protein
MRHLMLARLAKEAPYLLPLVDAVKRGVTIRQPLKREAFSPPRSARAILWLCDHPSGGPATLTRIRSSALQKFLCTVRYRNR